MSATSRLSRVRLAFFLVVSLFISTVFASANPPPKSQPIGSSGLNDLIGQKIQPGTFTTEQQGDGSFLLTNKLQTVSAHITNDKVQFDSVGNSAGKGGFAMQLTKWGRDKHLKTVASSKIYADKDAVYHAHTNGIAEKFSNTANGIQQDFVIASKPEGKGNLHIELQVSDASVEPKGKGAVIKLKSGRQLSYDRLLVTDNANKTIPAKIIVKSSNILDISVGDTNAQYPLTIDPTVGSAAWVAVGSGVGCSSLAFDSTGNLYCGGGVTIGGVFVPGVAKWDGTAWSVLGGEMNNSIDAIAIDSHDNLYVGGDFTTAGGVTVNHIAMWNGSAWSALSTGMDYVVNTLVIDSHDNLYAGGNFAKAGGVTVDGVAKWDGSSWSALGSGMDDEVDELAADSSGNVYAGGPFTTAGGVTVNGIAKWNGTSWSSLGSGVTGSGYDCGVTGSGNVGVYGMAVDHSNGNLYVGGLFSSVNGVSANCVAKWDGSVWSALGNGVKGGGVGPLSIDSNGNVYAGGSFTKAGGASANYIAEWKSGTGWSALGSGTGGSNPDVYALVVDGSGNVYASGAFTTAGGVTVNDIAEWKQTLVPVKVAHDYAGDGKDDVLFLDTSTGGTEYWKDGVKAQAVYPGKYDTSYSYAGTGDFDGDGKADILFTRASNNGTLIWSGAVKANASYPGTGSAGFSVAAICDTNGDGKADIVWSNATTGGTQIWPSATKSAVTYPGPQATGYSVVACGDFDGDGKADLFWRNNLTGADQIWRSGSKSTTTYPGAYADLTWNVIGAADTDGDGKADLIWYRPSTGATQVWKSGLESAAIYPGTNATTFTPKAIGDYDGDGKADLLWVNTSTGGTQIWSGVVKANVTYPGTYTSGFSIQK